MAKFLVTDEAGSSGVYRAGVGLVLPGSELELPDAATPIDGETDEPVIEAPHWSLVPLDQDADDALQAIYGDTPKAGLLKHFGKITDGSKTLGQRQAKAQEQAGKGRGKAKPARDSDGDELAALAPTSDKADGTSLLYDKADKSKK